jgi:hypothetical protein
MSESNSVFSSRFLPRNITSPMMRFIFLHLGLILIFPAFSQVTTGSPDHEKYVGYYNVGVKPGTSFFKARVYLRDAELYIIFDGDSDHKLVADANGTIRFDGNALSRYLITFDFKDDKAISFKVQRPRDKWPTDLFGERIASLDKYAIDTEETLTNTLTSSHFEVQFSNNDSVVVRDIISSLEAKYDTLLRSFGLNSTTIISIKIYPDIETYHNAVLTPGAPAWQMGRAWTKREIRMLSPKVAQQISNERQNAGEIVLHEFVHCLHLHLVKSATPVPGWLWEGVAMYIGCCRWVELKDLDYMKKKKYPSLKQIEQDRTFQKKYDLGYALIEFIDKTYGWEKVLELMKKNGDIKTVLGMSVKEFERAFYANVMK